MSSNPLDNGYVMVAQRHAKFVEEHPNGAINSSLVLSQIAADPNGAVEPYPFVVMRCEIWKDREDQRAGHPADGVGHASMPIPGPTNFTKNSEVENAETSALGRALAMIGYHAKETMASEDEIISKGGTVQRKASKTDKATVATKNAMVRRSKSVGLTDEGLLNLVIVTTGKQKSADLTNEDVNKVIDAMDEIDPETFNGSQIS